MYDSTPIVARKEWGITPRGEPVDLFRLRNRHGIEVHVTNYGGMILRVLTPDVRGRFADVVLGLGTLAGYTNPLYFARGAYFGAIVGRCANRIAGGRFLLNDRMHTLALNRPPNHLHGGVLGFDKVVWAATSRFDPAPTVELKYTSRDGEEGYPGNLEVTVTYTLSNDNALKLEYSAVADQDTVVNLTNHSYFNLRGHDDGDISGHEIQIDAQWYTPIDESLVPTGEMRSVRGSAFDFLEPRLIGDRIRNGERQLQIANGYDHNFVLNGGRGRLKRAAQVSEPNSGRTIELWTTEPGLQFYSGNYLKGTFTGKHGRPYGFRAGFCLETQHFPNSVNEQAFPSPVLKAGQRHHSMTVMQFRTASEPHRGTSVEFGYQ
jgi:aldose 1-epimerase